MKNKQISVKNIVVGIAALVGVIGVFLPWAQFSMLGISISANGTEGIGWISLIMFVGILGIVAYDIYKKASWAKIGITVAAGVALLIAIIELIDTLSSGLTLGFGLILVFLAALVCGIMPWLPIGKGAKKA